MLNKLFLVALTALMPISELRGAIPLGFSLGISPILIVLISIIANILIFFPIYFGLKLFYNKYLYKIKFVQTNLKRIRKKKKYIDNYGFFGLILIVAIPLPFTGVWTGTILAWLLGLDLKKSFISICCGVLIAAIIVTLISFGIINNI